MIKRIFLALTLMGSAASANPFYLNYENNRSYQGGGEPSADAILHFGYEQEVETFEGKAHWFVQGGPFISDSPDNDMSGDWSIKTGGDMPLYQNTVVYGELDYATGNSESPKGIITTQIGIKYNFN